LRRLMFINVTTDNNAAIDKEFYIRSWA